MYMARMSKMVGFTVPAEMAEELESIAREEQRTKSELFREMFRVYRNHRRQRQQDEQGDRLTAAAPSQTKSKDAPV